MHAIVRVILPSYQQSKPRFVQKFCPCLQAIHRYQKLAEVLQGEQPRQLLPPTPKGYILARVRALAEGPCMTAFTWNSGGGWGHKPWSNELPTDSAVVFFLFAACLEVSKT